MQKFLDGALPAVLFVYLTVVLTFGGTAMLAMTLPIFTMIYAFFGAWVLLRGATIEAKEDDSRLKNRQ